ncbi:hypothetical protein LAUMK13_03328 [Mycobacterium innocens]|uniref:Uncharacterized protein n=1 Tax=Mycobacterium innocens TaxID=2341083 RepID=A0A498Q6N3_9MYCO|nr:hypothetical protein LAUMK13_03328 [Mycobacterium innocens]
MALTLSQARSVYDRIGRIQDWQAFYEDTTKNRLVVHAELAEARQSLNSVVVLVDQGGADVCAVGCWGRPAWSQQSHEPLGVGCSLCPPISDNSVARLGLSLAGGRAAAPRYREMEIGLVRLGAFWGVAPSVR